MPGDSGKVWYPLDGDTGTEVPVKFRFDLRHGAWQWRWIAPNAHSKAQRASVIGWPRLAANQVVDLPVFFAHPFEICPFHRGVGGPNGLVRFLGPIALGGIVSRFVGKVGLAVGLIDESAGHLDRFGGKPGRIGSHVGDVPVLIQLLGDAHGALWSETQKA